MNPIYIMKSSDKITYLDNINNNPATHNKINSPVNLCIYSIYDTDEPYVLYLLHNLNNKLYWPRYKSTKKDISDYSSYLKQMAIVNYEYQGYIESDNEIYMYIKVENNFIYDKVYHNNINWFVTIHEILFPRMSWIYQIDHAVTDLFIKHQMSIYLYKNDNRLDIPEVAYYSTSVDNNKYNTNIGLENNSITGITVYNYDNYLAGRYIRVILFLYKYIVPDIKRDIKIKSIRGIDIDKDNYEILSCHVI